MTRVVLGRGLADDHDIAIGRRMDVPGRSFLVVGFSSVAVRRSAERRGWWSSFLEPVPTAEEHVEAAGHDNHEGAGADDNPRRRRSPGRDVHAIEGSYGRFPFEQLFVLPRATVFPSDEVLE